MLPSLYWQGSIHTMEEQFQHLIQWVDWGLQNCKVTCPQFETGPLQGMQRINTLNLHIICPFKGKTKWKIDLVQVPIRHKMQCFPPMCLDNRV
jgi:hypothetical protein